jgi:uncharacterized protein DUF4159/squalene-hopene cyclase-like protein
LRLPRPESDVRGTRHTARHPFRIVAVALTLAMTASVSWGFSDQDVEEAIRKAVDYLWSQQQPDGGWGNYQLGEGSYPLGPTALACYALLESGIPPQEARMARALEMLGGRETEKTYTLGLRCNVWLAAARKDKRFLQLLRKDVERLVTSTAKGSYDYDCRGDGGSGKWYSDNSNSQYGLLGVWAGARAGLQIPQEYWVKATWHWAGTQLGDGGWGYNASGQTTRTMTAAGVASLFVCFDNLLSSATGFVRCRIGPQETLAHLPIDRGLRWFDREFERTLSSSGWRYYYLYGLERVGLASGRKHFGGADWYKRGTEIILRDQQGDGAVGRSRRTINTAFSLLFLIRGRNTVLFNKLQYPGDWNNRPRALASLTRWVGEAFERTVNWQVIPVDTPVEEWHDAPILFLAGHRAPSMQPEQIARLREYVYQGGTLFSVTEANGSGFRKGVRKLYEELFPGRSLELCPADHALRNVHFRLPGSLRLHAVSNGVRLLAIHCEDDLSLPWQLQDVGKKPVAFEAAANVAMYLTDKGAALRRRGTSLWPDKKAPSGFGKTVKIARVRHAGNFDPEPFALERFAQLMARDHDVSVEQLGILAATDLPGSEAKLAFLTGTEPLELSDDEKAALKRFVDNGGTLLIDAAGGDAREEGANGFIASASTMLKEIYPQRDLLLLSRTSPLFQLEGMEINRVQWRRRTRQRLGGAQPPTLEAILLEDDRPGVVFSAEDLTAGLVGYPSLSVDGYHPGTLEEPGSAFQLVRNVAMFAARTPSKESP